MSECRIAAPAAQTWLLLSSPQSWTGITGGEFTVEFIRREGDGTCEQAHYRFAASTGAAEVTVSTDPSARTAHLRLTGTDTDVLAWMVERTDNDNCVLRWVATGELPTEVSSAWQEITAAGPAIARCSSTVDRIRTIADTADPAAVARELAPLLGACAADSAAATLDVRCVAAIRAAGLFRLGAPPVLGGREFEPRTVIDTVAELARSDAAAGWSTFIGNQSAYLAWFDKPVGAARTARQRRSALPRRTSGWRRC